MDRIFAAMSKGHVDAQNKPDFERQRVDYVGPQVGKQLRNKGIMAVLYAMIAILVYVAFRFDFKFGPGALVAMVHDVIMVLGYYLVTRAEFSLTALAYMWAQIAKAAQARIAAGETDPYYANRLAIGRYYVERVLPETGSRLAKLTAGSATMMALPADAF